MTTPNWDTVPLIKISFLMGTSTTVRLIEGGPLNTGFSEVSLYFESVDEVRKLEEVCTFR